VLHLIFTNDRKNVFITFKLLFPERATYVTTLHMFV